MTVVFKLAAASSLLLVLQRNNMKSKDDIRFYMHLTEFRTYQDYLDSRVKPLDLYYTKSRQLARKLVEQGIRGTILSYEEFEETKAAVLAAQAPKAKSRVKRKTHVSAGKVLTDTFLKELAAREEAHRIGKMNSIIFLRDHNLAGQEISGYIDYAHRLLTHDLEPIFRGDQKLMPLRSDLCFYNWTKQDTTSQCSPNYEVMYDSPKSLLFRNKRDNKILDLEFLLAGGSDDDFQRIPIQSDLYTQVVLYDHHIKTF
ncbi:cilia- and flagella-associated protein 299 isoform X1 [Synchiropus splendidus]|uniref:cilia- and flagella-associated protein 299 isoform X1 n=1 Tax=Synchiropus splendidus TaxID=270530 RepID=UPI00237D9645|nr:cilia- and flagella-associated protein 299 isoform X1 [Synchiropus splendidus]